MRLLILLFLKRHAPADLYDLIVGKVIDKFVSALNKIAARNERYVAGADAVGCSLFVSQQRC